MNPIRKLLATFYLALFFLVGGVSAMFVLSGRLDFIYPKTSTSNSILEAPVADFSFVQNDLCGSSPVVFTNLSTGSQLTYLWEFGDGQSSTLESPEYIFDNAIGNGTQSYVVELTVTDSLGVTNTKTETITVNQIPSTTVISDRFDSDFDNLPFFIVCDNEQSAFTFFNNSSTKETNVSYTIEWGDGTEPFVAENWEEVSHAYPIGVFYLDYTVVGGNGCSITKRIGVFIGSNPAVGFGNPGNTNICSGEALTFPITGTENNPSGTVYTVTFSDGSEPQVFNHPPPPSVSHIFTETSCGKSGGQGFPNSFSATILAENPCSKSSAQVVPIYVTEKPEPIIGIEEDVYCVNTFFEIENQTLYGNEANNSGQCTNIGKFVWEISPTTGWELSPGNTLGTLTNPNIPNSWINGSMVLTPRFTEPGVYTIKLISGNRCGIEEITETVCIIPEPIPAFEVDILEGCGPVVVRTTNNSNILETCAAPENFLTWSVSIQGNECSTSDTWSFLEGTGPNSINPVFEFTSPGNYLITQTLNTPCGVFSDLKTVTVFAPPLVAIENIPDACGELVLNPLANVSSCGSESTVYKWTFEGGTPATANTLDPGSITFSTPGIKNITLEVTNSCGTVQESIQFELNPLPVVDAGEDKSICKGEILTLDAIASPEGNYTYSWSSDPVSPIENANTKSPTIQPDQTTKYIVQIRNTDTGCLEFDEVLVAVIPAPTVKFSIPDQEICSGESTSAVNLISDPTGYDIEWTAQSNGVGGVIASGINVIPSQLLTNITNAPIDVIFLAKIVAEDLGACEEVVGTYKITVNPEPVYIDDSLEICSGSNLDFTPENLIPGSLFTWTVNQIPGVFGAAPSTQPSSSIQNTLSNNTNEARNLLYQVTPFLGSCPGKPFSLIVTLLPSPGINFSIGDQVLCTGTSSSEVLISSPVPSATFTWTASPNGVEGVVLSGQGNTIPVQNLINPSPNPLTVEYQVSAFTGVQNSCSGIPQIYKITVNPSISLTEQVSDFSGFEISCFGANDGRVSVIPSGGNGNFIFTWTGPNGYTSGNQTIENLAPGQYELLIEDEFGCNIAKSYTLTEPEALLATFVEKTDVFCTGDNTGRIEVAVSGGVEPEGYQFNWTKDGQIFEADSPIIENLQAGTYELTLVDNNNCSVSTGPILIAEPEVKLQIQVNKEDISCYEANDGKIDLNIIGGVAPYQIDWDFGSNATSFENVGPGTYTVTVEDQAGCIVSESVNIVDAPLFKVSSEVTQITCFGEQNGAIELNIEGGNEGVNIRWDNGQELPGIFNLGPGNYGVTVTKFGTCPVRREFTIIQPDPLVLESVVTDALSCDNPQSGNILVNVAGGTPPFTFKWSNGSTQQNLINLSSGPYSLEVTDANGCITEGQFQIKRPAPIEVVTVRNTKIVCEPRAITEEFNISITGGVPPYSIQWSNGSVEDDGLKMSTRQPGLYLLSITDAVGCSFNESFEVENTDVVIDASIQSTGIDQNGSFLVGIPITFQNKSVGNIISYFWDFGDGNSSSEISPTHTYQKPGKYTVTLQAIDENGCILEVKKEIEITDFFLVVPNVFSPNADGINDYFFPKFINITKMEFWILNKWGETIFYTEDINSQGWDGKVGGDYAMPGNYVYRLKFETVDGRVETQTEVFLLLK
ncbi:PKD domain-containing protein [Aquiflexum gelatinilyticum]|uniref:PKD domain-containing protein n=1 Tax=Aquiflexum gelatinilyticum TaxID=2961943 RepID=UPI0023DFD19F|nr:PKD domain-containing protein [Aquiflexum gelatinilyticum]